MEEEKLGIENIEAVLSFCLDLGLKVADDLDDGKLSTGEIVSLTFQIPKGISTAKKIKQAIAEAKDIDPEELTKILTLFVSKLNINIE